MCCRCNCAKVIRSQLKHNPEKLVRVVPMDHMCNQDMERCGFTGTNESSIAASGIGGHCGAWRPLPLSTSQSKS